MIHEAGHGLMALASGALLDEIQLDLAEWGETLLRDLHSGPGFVLTVSAGYIGSMFSGALLLNRGLSESLERTSLAVFAAFLFYVSLLFTSPGSVAFLTGTGWAFGLIVICLLDRRIARIALVVLGTFTVWYCIFDLFDFTRDIHATDAGILARFMGARFWWPARILSEENLAYAISIVWTLLMLSILILILRPAIFRKSPTTLPDEANNMSDGLDLTTPEFPAEITPAMEEWFLSNGFGLDGKPLPAELVDSDLVPDISQKSGQSSGNL